MMIRLIYKNTKYIDLLFRELKVACIKKPDFCPVFLYKKF